MGVSSELFNLTVSQAFFSILQFAFNVKSHFYIFFTRCTVFPCPVGVCKAEKHHKGDSSDDFKLYSEYTVNTLFVKTSPIDLLLRIC